MTTPSGILFYDPRVKPISTASLQQANATVAFYLTGTSTPTNVYNDGNLVNALTQPVVAASDGRFVPIYLDPKIIYRVVMKTAGGVLISDTDPYVVGQTLFGATAAEIAAGLIVNTGYPVGDVLRYGLVPNSPSAALANTQKLLALVSESGTGFYAGPLNFTNTTGSDIYYLNDIIDFRDGVHVDLCSSTINFTKLVPTAHDVGAGFFYAVRDFVLENGTIVVNYPTQFAGNAGAVLYIGARASNQGAGQYWPNTYDASLPVPQGNVILRNLRTSSNTPGGYGLQMTGGLQNVLVQNIWHDGGGQGAWCNYEYGFATNGGGYLNAAQSSHGHNLKFENIHIENLSQLPAGKGNALTLTGAYSASVENFYVNKCNGALSVSPGESMFYRPWVPIDQVGAKRNIAYKNIVVSNEAATAMAFLGAVATTAGTGYLGWIPSKPTTIGSTVFNGPVPGTNIYVATQAGTTATSGGPTGTGAGIVDGSVVWNYLQDAEPAQTDLCTVTVDNFTFSQDSAFPANGWAFLLQGGTRIELKNGHVTGGFQRGIFATDELMNCTVDSVDIFNCSQYGIGFGVGVDVSSPSRAGFLTVRNCHIIGNSTSSAGTYAGIYVNQCNGCLIENNSLGANLIRDGYVEPFQGSGVIVTNLSTVQNVVCSGNNVTTSSGAVAYRQQSLGGATNSNGCAIRNPLGNSSFQVGDFWDDILTSASVDITCTVPGNLSVTYATANDHRIDYIMHGSRIDYTIELTTSGFTHTSGESGNVLITGLPVQANNALNSLPVGALYFQGITKASYTQFALVGSGGQTSLQIACAGSGQTLATLQIADVPTGGSVKIRGTGHYYI